MALVEEALLERLETHTGLLALIDARVYAQVLPKGCALPAVAFKRLTGVRVRRNQDAGGLAWPRFRVTAWSADYDTAKVVGEQVRLALQGWTGTVAGVTIQRSFIEGDSDIHDETTGYHGAMHEFVIYHDE